MSKYRKLPVVIEAIQYTGRGINLLELQGFVGKALHYTEDEPQIFIRTLEGMMHVSIGDYVIKGVSGEFYPCKPDIFEKTYEEVTE